MTFGQEDIKRYLESQFIGVTMEAVGDGRIKVTDKTGETMEFGINIFGDILEVKPDGTKKVVAESDLPHNLDKLPTFARPKRWTTLPY